MYTSPKVLHSKAAETTMIGHKNYVLTGASQGCRVLVSVLFLPVKEKIERTEDSPVANYCTQIFLRGFQSCAKTRLHSLADSMGRDFVTYGMQSSPRLWCDISKPACMFCGFGSTYGAPSMQHRSTFIIHHVLSNIYCGTRVLLQQSCGGSNYSIF